MESIAQSIYDTTVLYAVRKTIFQMLRDRGYKVSDKNYNETFDQFTQSYNGTRESLNKLFQLSETTKTNTQQITDHNILVFYPDDVKVGASVITQIATKMGELNVFRSIVVIKD